jgi:hypothetical protein
MSKAFPGVDIDAVHGGRMPKTGPTADARLLADLDALVAYTTDKTGKMPMPDVCDIPGTMRRAADALRRYVHAGPWIDAKDALPDEDRAVFFMTKTAHWAGERCGDSWFDSCGDSVCNTPAVLRWQYAPASSAWPDAAATISSSGVSDG